MQIKKYNRRKARQPSKAAYWCGCDAAKVGQSGKCPKCKSNDKGMRDKKAAPLPALRD